MSQAGPSTSRYSLRTRDNPPNERRRKRSDDDSLEGETDVCEAWQAGKCTKGRKCGFRHGKYRRTDVQSGDVASQVNEQPEAIEQFIVRDHNLVTYGPGLDIRNIVPGYDLSQIILQLPIDTTKEDIERLFLQQGLSMTDFHVLRIENDYSENTVLRATVVTKLQHGKKKVIEGLRKRRIDFVQVRHNAIWAAKPALTVTWESTNSPTNERRVTRSSSSPSVAFETVYQTLCDSQGAQMKTCYLLNMGPMSEEALTLEFDTWENAQETARTIEEMNVPSLGCNVHKPYQYSIRIPIAQYEAQKKQWLAMIKKKKKQDACVKVNIGGKYAMIQVEGKGKKFIGTLKTRVENLARGEVRDGTYWHPSFTTSGDSAAFFQRVTDTTAVHIRCDPDNQALRLYGEPRQIIQARSMIQQEVQERERLITKTKLTGASVAFFKGDGLGKLQELVGEDNVNLKVTPKTTTIMVRGGEATHHFRRLLGESSVETFSVGGDSQGADKPSCPACFDEASYPERLECGHSYCPGCLKNLLTAVVENKTFPIKCIGDEATCNVPIPLPFIRHFLPQHTFKRLLETAFMTYLEQNPMQIQYCATPGCGQTFRRLQQPQPQQTRASRAVVLSCPSCQCKTCLSCAVEHDDLSCKEYRRLKELKLQEGLFVELARSNDYRRCPRCNVLVEKVGGCDNMYCKCKRSLNWKDFTHV